MPLDELLISPDYLLHAFEGDEAVFVPMDRAAYRRSIFLDNRISLAAGEPQGVALADLLARLPSPQPLQWIFHVAHCGSTLLARALDDLGGGLVLREPPALRQVALEPDPERLRLVLTMLAKRYPGDGATLVKANVPVNFILPAIASAQPQARAIFLHLGLRDYCLAILRSEQHRGWLRHVTSLLAAHLPPFAAGSDAERAAALWLAQIERFAVALAAMPRGRSLDAERFYAAPERTLRAAAALLGRPAGGLAAVTAGPLFAHYSKRPGVAFDNAARLALRAAAADTLAGEIAHAEAWLGGKAETALAMLAARAL